VKVLCACLFDVEAIDGLTREKTGSTSHSICYDFADSGTSVHCASRFRTTLT